MAGSGPCNLGFQNEMMKRILLEAQDHWLRPDDVIEILRNYQKADISAERPNKPASGSVFLFDRKALRNFRKDGHYWRWKKHEPRRTLKIGVDSLCYSYVRGVDNVNFQRRTCWLLERDLKHTVFVHYLEVKPMPIHLGSLVDKAASTSEINSSFSFRFHGTSPFSTLSSAYEDAKWEDNHKVRARFHSYPESPLTHYSQSSSFNPLSRPGEIAFRHETCCSLPAQANWKYPTMNQILDLNIPSNQENEHQQNYSQPVCILPHKQKEQLKTGNLQMLLLDIETANASNPDMENIMTTNGNKSYPYILERPLIRGLQNEESLKKVDSISSGIAKEHAETDENSPNWAYANVENKDDKIENGLFSEEESSAIESIVGDDTFMSWAFQ